jgi:RimJ/RimL family protein N-acetyltransferase
LTKAHCVTLWDEFGFAEGDFSLLQWIAALAPPTSAANMWELFEGLSINRGLITYAIVGDPNQVNYRREAAESSTTQALGMIGYLDINTKHRSLETGAVLFGKRLQRSTAATEAHYLLLRNVFEPQSGLPYRRVAWKNNALNVASRRAAQRIGYLHEGTWRNHWILNGKTRDSDWLSVIEEDWPLVKLALERWLDEKNFDREGKQLWSVEDIRSEIERQTSLEVRY